MPLVLLDSAQCFCGVSALATFLDRAPYIWFWRPTYRVFGSWIRECKAALIGSGDRVDPRYESRFKKIEAVQRETSELLEQRLVTIEAVQRETSELLEQILVTVLGDRQVPHAIEEMKAILATELSKHAADASAKNAAHRAAVERLVLAHIEGSNRSQIAVNKHQASILESAPRAGKAG